jgi:hypothetical protein
MARTCRPRAFVFAVVLMDFGLRARRFNVAVWIFFGFNAQVFASFMNVPIEFPRRGQ